MLPYTKDLKYGDSGPDVKALQERLIALGFGICMLEGEVRHLTAEGEFADITRECLESFQAKVQDAVSPGFVPEVILEKYPFAIDGVMNYSDWYLLANYEALQSWYKITVKPKDFVVTPVTEEPGKLAESDVIKRVIELAKKEIGTVEDKPHNNSGKRVNEYQWTGSCEETKTGAPWCQYFMNWLLKQLKVPYKWTCSGYTPDNVNFAVKKKCGIKGVDRDSIRVGDFGYIYSPSRGNARHVFLIIGIDLVKGTVTTIEGNTNNDGSADGFGVFKRSRPMGQVWAIGRWSELYK